MRMRLTLSLLALPAGLVAQAQPMVRPATMTNAQFIAAARTGAPAKVSTNATVARINADTSAWQWLVDAFTGKPKPTNTVPGISYMAMGGIHHETASGEIKMTPDSTTHRVKEPPHWMLMWPVDAAVSGLPTKAVPGGAYIMFAGTPYAHLMVYQDPAAIVK